jgi:adenine-specific DNA-methyltransferase
MRDRLECIGKLLTDDGFLFVHIDYRESARLKLILDEVIGAGCFRNEIIVGRGTKNVQSQFAEIDSLASGHDTIYLYSRNPNARLKTLFARMEDPQPGKWDTFWRGTDRPTMRYELFGITPQKGQWRWSKERAYEAKRAYEEYCSIHQARVTLDEYWHELEVMFGRGPDFVRKEADGTVQYYVGPRDYKMSSDVWLDLRTLGKVTDFPHEKHEDILERIVDWVTEPGDWVLDSFAGSGTTGAVAHKMGRRWIMVELGEHCHTHIIPRLKKVIDGEDPGGVTEAVGWTGGGGFRYYRLAPSLLEKDKWGNWVINKEYNAAMLTEAVCKLEGFQYAPSDAIYWQHGHSTERDFIYVTTAHLGHDQLQHLSDEVGPDRTLLVLCTAFRLPAGQAGTKPDRYPNLTVKKIPKTVLSRCEWGHDDYSLRVENLPKAPPKPGQMDLALGGGAVTSKDGGASDDG